VPCRYRLSILSGFRNNGPKKYWDHDHDLSRSRDVIYDVIIQFAIGHFLLVGRLIDAKPLSQTVFEIFASKYNWVSILAFLGHVTLSVTWPFDTAHAISYMCPIVTESLSRAVFKITGNKILGWRPWPFKVTWRHRWRHHSIHHRPFYFLVVGRLIDAKPLFKPFSRYLHLNITRSRLWPFWVTWSHRSRDHSISHIPFPICAPL